MTKNSKSSTEISAAVSSPIFLVGAERSGTTLLRLMLDHHPQISWGNEFSYAVDWVPEHGWPNVQDYHRKLADDRIFRATGLKIDPTLNYVELVNDFLQQWRRRSGKPIVGAQVHRHFDTLLRIWPGAKFIHLVRDPRDVARSRMQMGWAGNTLHATRAWIEAETLWGRLREQVPRERRLEIWYEELIAHPEPELTRICNLIGVPYEPSMLEYYRNTTYAPVDTSLGSQWQRTLSGWGIRLVEADSAELMEQRGYQLSGLPRLSLGLMARAALAIQDKLSRARFRIRNYGMTLWFADVVSRRIGSDEWRKRVVLKLRSIDQLHIK